MLLGTAVNIGAIAVGATIGMVAHSRIPKRLIAIAFQGIGLVTVAIGVRMCMDSSNLLLAIVSVVAGALIGEGFRLEEHIERGSEKLKRRLHSEDGHFTEGLVTAAMIYCVGSMSILGSIEDGLGFEPKILFAKSIMDGVVSVALAAAYGPGVLFAIIPVLTYQGLITLLASRFSNFMAPHIIADLTCVGGILLIGLAINILEIKKISLINMLPAILIIIPLSYFFG